MAQSCKTCVFLRVLPNRAGKRVAYKDNAYQCVAPPPEAPAMSDAIMRSLYATQAASGRKGELFPFPARMHSHEGTNCPVYQPILKDPRT